MTGSTFVVPYVLCRFLDVADGLGKLNVVVVRMVLEVGIAKHYSLVRGLVLQEDEHGVLGTFQTLIVRQPFSRLAQIDQQVVNHEPLLFLVGDCDCVMFVD